MGRLRYCGRCVTTKDATEFHKKQGWCKRCHVNYNREYREKNRDVLKEKAHRHWVNGLKEQKRASHLFKTYGLTLAQYTTLYATQNNVCAICKTVPKKPCVDHCHKTGKVRGILCDLCNTGLGRFKDNVQLMREALKYMESHAL